MQTDNFWLEKTFKSFEPFWIFCRNLWHGSQSFVYVSRVKFPEETVFLTFLFKIFFQIWAKYFQTLAIKTSRSCQIYPLRVQTNNFWLEIFFISFEPFWIFCRKLWHGSQTSICVSRVKIPEEFFFYSSFQVFFGFWAKMFSDFWPKNFKKFSKLHSKCPEEQFVAWIIFKFWIALDFLQKPLAWFSNFYLRVQSKNSGRFIFFILLFGFFFGFWAKVFPDFWPEKFKKLSKLPSKCPEEQFVAWNLFLKIWIVLDFLQKTLQWFSNIYLRVQSKKSGRKNFFILLLRFVSDFERKKFQTFGQKTSRSCQN